MTPEQRHLWRDIRRGIGLIDGLFRRVAEQVRALMDRYTGQPLTHARRRDILRGIDAILAPVFGLTKRAAQTAELTSLIIRASAETSEGVWRRAYDRLASIVERRDPALWQRVRARLLADVPELRVATLPDLEQLTPAQRQELIRAMRAQGAPQRARVARSFDPNRRWVDPRGYRLSDRVWNQGRGIRQAIDARLRLAITRGEDPIAVARELERYLHPRWQPLRYLGDGRIIVDGRKQVITLKPRGGHGSNAARRLVRTEIIGAHGRATIEAARHIPGVIGVKWNLSAMHPDPDECNDKAAGSSKGLPRGVYEAGEVPTFPSHPNELCYLTHEHTPREQLIDQLVARYG